MADSLGEALKQERNKKKITLEQISDRTNISVGALTALENEQYDRLPGTFYIKNYIKNYLTAIDGDVDGFLEIHHEKIQSACGEYSPNVYCTKVRYSRFKKRNLFFSILMTIVIVVGVTYLLYTRNQDIFGGWNSTVETVSIPETGIRFETFRLGHNFSNDYAPLHVDIQFSENCWMQVSRGGEKLFQKTYKSGEEFSVDGYNLRFYIANPAGVNFRLNGREVTYLKDMTKPETLDLTPANADEIYKK